MGPKSLAELLDEVRGAEGGSGRGEAVILAWVVEVESVDEGLTSMVGASSAVINESFRDASLCFGWVNGPESFESSISSKAANDAKSVSFRGGAGADGDIVAFRGMFIGGRPVGDTPADTEFNKRVGAVEPPVRREFLPAELAPPPVTPWTSRFPLSALGSLLPPPVAAAAAWAAFLFFLSIAML